MNKEDELYIYYSIEPANATNKTLVWSSSDEKIKAKSIGDATITIKTQDNRITRALKVKIVDNGMTVNIKKEADKVAVYIKSKSSKEIVTLRITRGDNIKYIDQINLNNNTQKVTTILENGQYKLFVKGLNIEVIIIDFTIN